MRTPDLTEARLGALLREVRGLRGDLRLLSRLVGKAVGRIEANARPRDLARPRPPLRDGGLTVEGEVELREGR